MAAPRALLGVISILLWTGCQSLPASFPPPAQRPSVSSGHFVMMGDPGADAFIVQGFRAKSETSWRWTHDHPVLRFMLPDTGPLKFTMDFALPEVSFRETGPVTLAIAINGEPFDRPHYDHPGDYQYSREVPEELLHKNGANLVAIDPDKCAGAEKLGFILARAGFAE